MELTIEFTDSALNPDSGPDTRQTHARIYLPTMLDLYCERVSSGFWAEPVNAFTNFGFVFAAYFCWRMARREQVRDSSIVAITVMIVAIGIGSFLFHTMPSAVTRWLDVAPVFVFQLLYLGLYCRRIIGFSLAGCGLLVLVFLVTALVASQFLDLINGSLIYLPALLVIFVLGVCHYQSQKIERSLLLAAACVFVFSLVLRSVDNGICMGFELGTHFLWHVLNALVIYMAMRALIVNLSTGSGRWLDR